MTHTPHPLRIQRRRTKGYKMPTGAVYCGRPTIWGNPWYDDWPASVCVENYRLWLTKIPSFGGLEKASAILKRISELRGKQLACWCPLDKPCHVDVLCEIANREPNQ